MTTQATALQTIEAELRFIARHSQQIEGSFEAVDEINMAVNSALRAMGEYKLSLQPEVVDEAQADSYERRAA